jgi:hypothetical protein
MKFLKKLVGFLQPKKNEEISNEPAYLGGDGLSKETPIFINCASSAMAEHLITQFICTKLGSQSDWKVKMKLTAKSDQTECGMIKVIIVETNSIKVSYFFDLSRPMRNPLN